VVLTLADMWSCSWYLVVVGDMFRSYLPFMLLLEIIEALCLACANSFVLIRFGLLISGLLLALLVV
jgi:hypothetical protein